jgi:hypothetical protein
MTGVNGSAGVSTPIDAREAWLRVLAASAATIIAGWTTYAAGQLGGTSGWRLIVWVAGCFRSALWCASAVARVVGRRKRRTYWVLTAGYVSYLPFITWLSAGPGPSGEKSLIDLTHGSLLLVVASMVVLIALGIAGFLLEQPSLPGRQQPTP